MAQSKKAAIMVNVEEPIYKIVLNLIHQEEESASGYCRKLIISDLRERGLLPDRLLAELFASS